MARPGRGLEGAVRIVEVGPRDGLQNERQAVPTVAKARFIRDLAAAGLRDIEATSFVNPKAIPQLADAGALLAELGDLEGTRLSALVPNMRGLEGALAAGVEEVAVFTASSDAFNQANIRCDVEGSFLRLEPVITAAREAGLRVRGYVSTVFGCPYQGEVEPERARDAALRLLELGCYEVSLGDTIGVATPRQVRAALSEVLLPALGVERVAMHFHDTRGTALANVCASLELGVRAFDSSAGGLGGCPYAPGAAGNLATEDLIYLLEGLGFECGASLEGVARASLALEASLDHPLPGRTVATFRTRA